ncbi:MAG TPA: short-chain dehydrogenase, partial [Ruminococcaceae bacterium]|nr:short-chain dehydrogenase [Oscillospiraceae bacterium]
MKIAVITGASSGLGREYAFETARSRREIDEI